MSQFRKGYYSLFGYVTKRFNDPATIHSNPISSQQLLGGRAPVREMRKDFVDTFKPYKTSFHALRDFIQPLIGLAHTVKGLAYLVVAPIVFVIDTFNHALTSSSFEEFISAMKDNFLRTASWLLDGLFSLIRGVTQILATPLTWLIKMPLRILITLIKGAPKIEQNPGIERLVALSAQANEDGYVALREELHRKFSKASSRGQNTNILAQDEVLLYGDHKVDANNQKKPSQFQDYIGLFNQTVSSCKTNTTENNKPLNQGLSK